jgi:hypothetical protein
MQFGGTVLYVDQVSPVVDFYRRAFGLELRFFDEILDFAELETGGSMLAIAAHSLGEMLINSPILGCLQRGRQQSKPTLDYRSGCSE